MLSKKDSNFDLKRFVFVLSVAGSLQFFCLTLAAMWFYPGGTYNQHDSVGYSFWRNFFSDLGLTKTFAGQPKDVSFYLFSIALIVIGVCLIVLFMTWPTLFKQRRVARLLSFGGSAVGVLSGLALIGVALTPADIYLDTHIFLVKIAFPGFLVFSVFYCVAIFLDRSYPNIYGYAFIVYMVILGVYLVLLFFGPSIKTDEGLLIQATGQKVIVYCNIACIGIEAYGAWAVYRRQQDI